MILHWHAPVLMERRGVVDLVVDPDQRRAERRLRKFDGAMEMHIVSFVSEADFQNYRNDPRRSAQAWLLERSSATLELIRVADV
ncbi:hypothetical protein G8O24_38085 [Bradyrhizobium sp. INPA01-394B]|uniref:DUF1330 domain-containing protein n=1 Tax=Bradyrhizobium campsiandrae TaxID=1729892 RepID=A0ABR7U271_9BRAD|nr:hypothetical protein [Bradyrhizobium campsiandrae]MBC9883105.1 hypothetical protein [Bradyrhizobium campsiandrae]MBC9978067.1 hypothetical protein [Bradyrhizobium campsiandrae]